MALPPRWRLLLVRAAMWRLPVWLLVVPLGLLLVAAARLLLVVPLGLLLVAAAWLLP
jgi:hypothetical protein